MKISKNLYPVIGAILGYLIFYFLKKAGIIHSSGDGLAILSGWSLNNPLVQMLIFIIAGVAIGWWVSKK